ncbi:MAG: DegV family protein [Actinobacteria bacterium]|nr:DegV family protein [Actinomycetota bacterium]
MTEGTARLTRANTCILVDSTADMPDDLAADPNVSMIPLLVRFGDESYRDWIDITPPVFYKKLRAAKELPTTSLPSVGEFTDTYKQLKSAWDNVFSIHLSAKISGTIGSATVAAEAFSGVTVIDSGICSSGVSLLVKRLLHKLDEGIDYADFMAYVEWFKRERGMLFLLDTLEYIAKGGRIGRAASLAGSLLSIKPILTFSDGLVTPFKKARGERKALQLIVDTFLEQTKPGSPVYIAIGHGDAPEKADELLKMLEATDREIVLSCIGYVGSVIGTYGGPGSRVIYFIQE